MGIKSIIVTFTLIHLIVGIIRGAYRYQIIKKYQYNYFDQSINTLGRMAHNWLYAACNLKTLFISVCLTILVFISKTY